MRHLFFAFAAVAAVVACSSDPKGKPSDAGVEAEAEAAAELVEGCETFVDRRDPSANRTLLWDQSISVDDSRCMQIKVGQTVTWANAFGDAGDFTAHPLIAFEGDTPNPIENLNYETGSVTFPAAGTFGYVCGTHPAMKGAILVTAQ